MFWHRSDLKVVNPDLFQQNLGDVQFSVSEKDTPESVPIPQGCIHDVYFVLHRNSVVHFKGFKSPFETER